MSRDTNFYYSFVVLPSRKRNAVVAVWDFCRAVDDAVDEVAPGPGMATRAEAQLEAWRDELGACYESGASGPVTAQGKALRRHVRELGLPRAPFEDVIDGVAMDLTCARYQTFDALAEYCHRVASAVGLICVEIFGYRDPKAREYATNLGVALQLTNIIRDVAGDLERGRIYLPTEDLARFGVSEGALREGTVTPEVRALLEFESSRARDYYQRAARCLPSTDVRSLVAAEIMSGIYFEILQRIERADYDVFHQRIRVPRPHRALIALRIWAKSLLSSP
jgi:phytoene synthase